MVGKRYLPTDFLFCGIDFDGTLKYIKNQINLRLFAYQISNTSKQLNPFHIPFFEVVIYLIHLRTLSRGEFWPHSAKDIGHMTKDRPQRLRLNLPEDIYLFGDIQDNHLHG